MSALELDSRCSFRPVSTTSRWSGTLLFRTEPLLSLQSQPTFAIGGWVSKSIPHSSRFWDTPFHTVNLQCPVQGKRQKSFKLDSFWCLFKVFKSIPHSSHFWDTPSWQSQNAAYAAARDHFFKKMQVHLVVDLPPVRSQSDRQKQGLVTLERRKMVIEFWSQKVSQIAAFFGILSIKVLNRKL